MTHDLLAMLGIYGGTFVVSLIAGLVPLVNTELFLIGVVRVAIKSPAQLVPLVLFASVGQMAAKIALYYTGRSLLDLPRGRYKNKVELLRTKIERWQAKPYLVYTVSSVLGLPPFYLTVLAAGAMRIRFDAFFLIGLLGRILRFAVIVAIAWAA
ncbi:MAG TPA: VTT domain-containing protein [Kofleriaceae bacterium]|nr:VTT domain-containing protein [Kofleriaceae bacterium]